MSNENSGKVLQPSPELCQRFLNFVDSGPHELRPAQQAALRDMGFKVPIADRPVAPSTKTLPRFSRAELAAVVSTEFDELATVAHGLFDDDEHTVAAPSPEPSPSTQSVVPEYILSTARTSRSLSDEDTLPPLPRTIFFPPHPPALAMPKLLLEGATQKFPLFDRRSIGIAIISALVTMGVVLTGIEIRNLIRPHTAPSASLICPPPVACPALQASPAAPLCSASSFADRPHALPPRSKHHSGVTKKAPKLLLHHKTPTVHRHRPKKVRRLPFLDTITLNTSPVRSPVVMIMSEYRLQNDGRDELDQLARDCGLSSPSAILGISPNKEIIARSRAVGSGPFIAGSSWRVPCRDHKFASVRTKLRYLFPYSSSAY